MERREHQMASFRRCQNRRDRLRIAHFPDQNHIRILPQDAPQRSRKIGRIPAHLDLLDDGLPVRVQKFNRVFNGHHVIATMRIHQIHQRGQRRTFAAAGGSRHQNQSLPRFRQTVQQRRQVQRFQRRDTLRQQPETPGQCSPLIMDIGPKAADALPLEAQVHRPVALQFLRLRRSQQRQQQTARVLGFQCRTAGFGKLSTYAKRNRSTGNQQQIRCRLSNGIGQQLIQRFQIPEVFRRRGLARITRYWSRAIQLLNDLRQLFLVIRHLSPSYVKVLNERFR